MKVLRNAIGDLSERKYAFVVLKIQMFQDSNMKSLRNKYVYLWSDGKRLLLTRFLYPVKSFLLLGIFYECILSFIFEKMGNAVDHGQMTI
jgi:hypothetical protein